MKKSIRKNNNGSALIVCIIVLLFVSILATVILYMAGVNYRMKKTDYRTRLTFYDSEKNLERMQCNLVIPVSEAINNSMLTANSFYALQGGAPNSQQFYCESFDYELKRLLIEQYGGSSIGNSGATISGSGIIKNVLHNLTLFDTTIDNGTESTGIPISNIICNDGDVLSDDPAYTANPYSFIEDMSQEVGPGGVKYFSEDGTYLVVTSFVGHTDTDCIDPAWENINAFIELDIREEGGGFKTDLSKCRLVFRNLCVVTVKDGYKSVVTTDLVVTIPPFDYSCGADYGTWNAYQLMYYRNWQKV